MSKEPRLRASLVLVTYCPDQRRRGFVEKSFPTIHNTGIKREDYELIVFDNGGIHRDLIEELDYDVLITCDHNIGVAAGLNAGFEIAISDNLVAVQDDVYYEDGWLKKGLELLDKYNDSAVAFFGCHRVHRKEDAGPDAFYATKAGGPLMLTRKLFYKIGRFAVEYYTPGGLWERKLIKQGHRLVISKGPRLMRHLGMRASMVARQKGMVNDFRNPRPS